MPRFEKNNPCSILAGQRCYAIHMDSFRPCDSRHRIATDILAGTLQSDYSSRPKGAVQEDPCYFLPDQPVPDTDVMSEAYHLSGWRVFPTMDEAREARRELARDAIRACEAEIAAMQAFL